jgi:hypothetical protein
MRITNAGNVGINTTSPSVALTVTGKGMFGVAGSSVPSTSQVHIYGANGSNGLSWADSAFGLGSYIQSTGGILQLSGRVNSSTQADPANPLVNIYDGGMGIGTTSTFPYQLRLSADSAGKPSTNTWTIVSDERIKEEIQLADLDLCYKAVKTIPLKRYKWRNEVYTEEQVTDRRKIGWIAQDVEAVFPKAVNTHEFKYNQVYAEIVIPAKKEELDNKGQVITAAQPKRVERKLVSEDVITDCKDLNADQIYAAMYGALQKLINKVESLEAEVALLKGA